MFALNWSLVCYAHDSAREHDKELERVLFTPGYSKYQSTDIKNNVLALEYASYLAIDQFEGNGESKYNELKKMGIQGLPLTFKSIDYSEDVHGKGKKIGANTHRLITHQGWEQDGKDRDTLSFWNKRRKVLLGTVNTVFGFRKINVFGYDERCNALCGIIYYTHILGDYEEAKQYKQITQLIDLAGHDGTDEQDMICQLKKYIDILFSNQKDTTHYKELIKGLDDIAKKAGKLVNSTGGVNEDDEFDEYHQHADETLKLMMNHIPELLKNEEFFCKVFIR